MYSQLATACGAPRAALILALAILLGGPSAAAQHHAHPPESGAAAQVGSLAITGAWARATPPAARTGAVYLTISNQGTGLEQLVSATTPAAAKVELHATTMEGGMARMSQVDSVEIRPGAAAAFQPAGMHIMLVDLRGPLRDGEHIQLALSFARAGNVTVDVPVRRAAPSGSGSGAPQHRH